MNILKYVLNIAGPSGFGSGTTADAVANKYPDKIGGRTFLITGATSPLGTETASVLWAHEGSLILLGRVGASLQGLKQRLLASHPASGTATVEYIVCDLTSLESVKMASRLVRERCGDKGGVHCIIHCATSDATACPASLTAEGFEHQVGVNVVAPFLLTQNLLPLLKVAGSARDPTRVVNVTSRLHSAHRPQYERFTSLEGYQSKDAYAMTKLCNILHACVLTRRCQDEDASVIAVAADPGVIHESRESALLEVLTFHWIPRMFRKSVAQGAATVLYCTCAEGVQGSRYYEDCNEAEPNSVIAKDPEEGQRLWEKLCALTSWTKEL